MRFNIKKKRLEINVTLVRLKQTWYRIRSQSFSGLASSEIKCSTMFRTVFVHLMRLFFPPPPTKTLFRSD